MKNPVKPRAVVRAGAEVGESVATWRKLQRLTAAQLADRAGVSRSTLSRLERGDLGVSLETVLRVLRALGVLESLTEAVDPFNSDVGRMRADEVLPQRVR